MISYSYCKHETFRIVSMVRVKDIKAKPFVHVVRSPKYKTACHQYCFCVYLCNHLQNMLNVNRVLPALGIDLLVTLSTKLKRF